MQAQGELAGVRGRVSDAPSLASHLASQAWDTAPVSLVYNFKHIIPP